MRCRTKYKVLKNPPYSNVRVLDRQERLIFRCGMNKANWYLERCLAKVTSEDPYTIQLQFDTKGLGNFGDQYSLSNKQNICVVCGISEGLTKHHVVPRCFRKRFPPHMKLHRSYDVLVLCVDCHGTYESKASDLKRYYAQKYNVVLNKRKPDSQKQKLKSAVNALLFHGCEIPLARIDSLIQVIQEYCQVKEVNTDLLYDILKIQLVDDDKDNTIFSKIIVEGESDLDAFCKEWRYHFVKEMNPMFLPDYWNLDRAVFREKEQK